MLIETNLQIFVRVLLPFHGLVFFAFFRASFSVKSMVFREAILFTTKIIIHNIIDRYAEFMCIVTARIQLISE